MMVKLLMMTMMITILMTTAAAAAADNYDELTGKTTIVNDSLLELRREGYLIERMITYTTRPMRKNVRVCCCLT